MQRAYHEEDRFVKKKKKFGFNIGLSNIYCNLWKEFDKVLVYFNFRCFFSFFLLLFILNLLVVNIPLVLGYYRTLIPTGCGWESRRCCANSTSGMWLFGITTHFVRVSFCYLMGSFL